MTSLAPARPVRARLGFALGLVALAALHVALTLHAHPWSSVIASSPLRASGYEAAAVDVSASLDSMSRGGKPSGYDPRSSAGSMFGVSVDRSTCGLRAFTSILSQFGVQRVTALNAFAYVGAFLPWLCVLAAAFVLGLSRAGVLTAGALALGLLQFDGLLRGAAFTGPPLLTVAGGLGLLGLALVQQFLRAGGSIGMLLAATLAGAGAGLLHPGAVASLGVGLVGLVVLNRRGPSKNLLGAGAVVVLALAAALPAMLVAAGAGLDPFGGLRGATPLHLLTDTLGLVLNREVSGDASLRSGVRTLALGAAIAYTVQAARGHNPLLGFCVAVLASYTGAYLGGLVPPIQSALPYHSLALGLLGTAVLGGALVQELINERQLVGLSRPVMLTLVVLAAGCIPRIAQDVGYFVPEIAPSPKDLPEEKPHIADMVGYGDIGYPRHRSFRHLSPPRDYTSLAEKLATADGKARRILVESPGLAQYLRARTSAQIIGSLPGLHLGREADLFSRYPHKEPSEAQLRAYLENYAIGWIVVRFNPDPGDEEYRPRLSKFRSLLEPVPLPLAQHRLYKVRTPSSYLDGSTGEAELAGQTLRVTGTDPSQPITLRYHYNPRLQCRPGCRLEKAPLPGDPTGFLQVAAPHPEDFEIAAHP